jgi:RNA polymerase sigma factor (sigma-70 family)
MVPALRRFVVAEPRSVDALRRTASSTRRAAVVSHRRGSVIRRGTAGRRVVAALLPREAMLPFSKVETVDAAILDAVEQDDERLAARLILRHFGPVLLGQARVIAEDADAEDVVMTTVMAILSAIKRGRFTGRGSLRSYAITTVRYQAFHLRDSPWQQMFRHAQDLGAADDLSAPPPSERPWGDRDESALADRLIATLDTRSRVVVTMRLEGMAFSAIARLMGISAASARQIHVRAIQRLRERVAEEGMLEALR